MQRFIKVFHHNINKQQQQQRSNNNNNQNSTIHSLGTRLFYMLLKKCKRTLIE